MEAPGNAFTIHVRTSWLEFSPALHWHARETIHTALAQFAPVIRSVTARLIRGDDNANGSVCVVEVVLKPSGSVSASASGRDLYRSVASAAERVRAELHRRLEVDVESGRLSLIA